MPKKSIYNFHNKDSTRLKEGWVRNATKCRTPRRKSVLAELGYHPIKEWTLGECPSVPNSVACTYTAVWVAQLGRNLFSAGEDGTSKLIIRSYGHLWT
jgi:hypothetical protein